VVAELDGAGGRGPDVLVHLELQATGQAIGEDPRGEVGGFEAAEDGTHQDSVDALIQAMRVKGVARPFVVAAIGEHELQLVAKRQMVEIAPSIARGLAAAGAFEIDDADGRASRAR